MSFEIAKSMFSDFVKKWKSLIVLTIAILLTYMLASYLIINKQQTNIYEIGDAEYLYKVEGYDVGIVFGGGVAGEEPLPLLQERLDKGKELLDKGHVSKLILSGFIDDTKLHNEPEAMYKYLVGKGVKPEELHKDTLGRSTFETCERAKRVFNIHQAILITESTHLPRALYLCEHFGMDAIGIKSDGYASSGLKIGQRWRETLARSKAVFNVYFIGEETVIGEKTHI